MAAILKNIGYTVVFNSKDANCNGVPAFILWEDVVGFAELCGNVIGTRSGFFDFAIIARANFFIFTPPAFINAGVERAFDVDNSDGHIRTIPIKGNRDFVDLAEFEYFTQIGRNFVEYIYDLNREKERYVIVIVSNEAHCPPAGSGVNKKLYALSMLGLKFDFMSSYGWSYCAVVDGGVIIEKYSRDKRVVIEYSLDLAEGNCVNRKFEVEAVSEGSNAANGNHCSSLIFIDGVQICMNKRGLNIVVWDKALREIQESVVFDTSKNSSVFDTDILSAFRHR